MKARALARSVDQQASQQWTALAWLTIMIFVIVMLTGCGGRPAVRSTGPDAPQASATISGTVRGPEGTTDVDGRVVEVVNVETFERHRAMTNHAGGFSIKVRPGKYRVELALRDGEALVRQPEPIDLQYAGGDDHADFVIGSVRASRPRPNYRAYDGLGSPIA